MGRAPSMFERYTDAARRVIFFAKVEATHRRENHISPRDILGGLIRESDSRATRIAPLQQNILLLRYLLRVPHFPITSVPYLDNSKAIPLNRNSKMLLAYACYEADLDRQYWLDSDHILRGSLCVKGDAADALKTIGLNLKAMRKASAEDRNEPASEPAPEWAETRLGWNRWKALFFENF